MDGLRVVRSVSLHAAAMTAAAALVAWRDNAPADEVFAWQAALVVLAALVFPIDP